VLETLKGSSIIILGIIFGIYAALILKPNHIDPELKPYYEEYVSDRNVICKESNKFANITIKIVDDLPKFKIGECRPFASSYIIKINKEYWKMASEPDKYQVMMHELTHCDMKLYRHVNSDFHYMAPYHIAQSRMLTRWQMLHLMNFLCNVNNNL